MSNVIKLSKKNKKARKNRKTWWEKHNDECDALRASVGARAGDGLKILANMRQGSETQRALADCYNHMSANMADAIVSLYASNPTLALLMKATNRPRLSLVGSKGIIPCPSSEPTSAASVSIE